MSSTATIEPCMTNGQATVTRGEMWTDIAHDSEQCRQMTKDSTQPYPALALDPRFGRSDEVLRTNRSTTGSAEADARCGR